MSPYHYVYFKVFYNVLSVLFHETVQLLLYISNYYIIFIHWILFYEQYFLLICWIMDKLSWIISYFTFSKCTILNSQCFIVKIFTGGAGVLLFCTLFIYSVKNFCEVKIFFSVYSFYCSLSVFRLYLAYG